MRGWCAVIRYEELFLKSAKRFCEVLGPDIASKTRRLQLIDSVDTP